MLGPASTQTYGQIQADLQNNYKNFVPAAALTWWWLDASTDFGLRVEVPLLMKEFTNDVNIGRDPEGLLYYHDAGDLTGSTKPFIAKDPNNTVVEDKSKNRSFITLSGEWKDLQVGSAAAYVTKTSSDLTWTMTVGVINKEVTFADDSAATQALQERVSATGGQLTFSESQIDDITKGAYVDYQNDRIVFTDTNEYSKKFSAYVILLRELSIQPTLTTMARSLLVHAFAAVETVQDPDPLKAYSFTNKLATWSNTG